MNSKERVYAALEGRKLDRFPVMVPYPHLSNADHWKEVTGDPAWKFYAWKHMVDPEKHTEIHAKFYEAMPFDVVHPWEPMPLTTREAIEAFEKDGKPFVYNRMTGDVWAVPDNIHEGGNSGNANETRYILAANDIKKVINVKKAEQYITDGSCDFLSAFLKQFPDKFVVSGGVVNTFYSNIYYVGMTNFFYMLKEEPELVHEISKRLLEHNIETLRAFCMVGGDAVFIDDATATNDMISVKMYEEFSLPYLTEQIIEVHRMGKKAIVVYFGGIADRLEQILSAKPDLIIMEASMKGYVNDYAAIHRQISGRCCLAGNLNPYMDVERKTEADLEKAIRAQAEAGRYSSRYITSTGSPLTPGTPVTRIKQYILMGHRA